MKNTKKYFPGKTKIGIMGSGQLGRMFAQKAIERGYFVKCYSPESDTPCGKVGVVEVVGEYSDKEKLTLFLKSIDVLTFEFENIPSEALDIIEEYCLNSELRVSPSVNSIRISQNRFKEKNFFQSNGLKTTSYWYLDSLASLDSIKDKIEFPCILKTNRFGYDGKGQTKCLDIESLEEYLRSLSTIDHILEGMVKFSFEISVVACRFSSGKILYYPASENIHKNHILDFTIHPARIVKKLNDKAVLATIDLLTALNYEGVLALEFFVAGEDVLCNEFAPRPHNSGHFTMDASNFSQFELQLLTLCNLEPDIPKLKTKRCIMKNIIGFDYFGKEETYANFLQSKDYKLHLYQKQEAKIGRKMGHWNYLGDKTYKEAFPDEITGF